MGSSFGPPSDLFSLGVTLYTAVEGQPPFDKGDPIATMHAVVEDSRGHRRAGRAADRGALRATGEEPGPPLGRAARPRRAAGTPRGAAGQPHPAVPHRSVLGGAGAATGVEPGQPRGRQQGRRAGAARPGRVPGRPRRRPPRARGHPPAPAPLRVRGHRCLPADRRVPRRVPAGQRPLPADAGPVPGAPTRTGAASTTPAPPPCHRWPSASRLALAAARPAPASNSRRWHSGPGPSCGTRAAGCARRRAATPGGRPVRRRRWRGAGAAGGGGLARGRSRRRPGGAAQRR